MIVRRQWSSCVFCRNGNHARPYVEDLFEFKTDPSQFFLTKRSKLTAHYPSNIILMLSAHRCDLVISEQTEVIVEQFYIRLLIIMYIF